MGIAHQLKERFRLIVEAAVRNVLNDQGLIKQPVQNKTRSVDEQIRYNAGTVLSAIHRNESFAKPADAGFRVYSQFDEDGIIDYLIRAVECPNRTFVEIGTEDYRESNTRFLLEHRSWRGVTIDGSNRAQEWMDIFGIAFFHDIRHKQAYVTAENINSLLSETFESIDLLSLDIDGVDYYVWKAIDSRRPRIVLIEFNPLFGLEHKITVPYRPDFDRAAYHYSKSVFGASLPALVELAHENKYTLVAISQGPNAFFIANEHLGELHTLEIKDIDGMCDIKDQFDQENRPLLRGDRSERLQRVKDVLVYDLSTHATRSISDIFRI